MVLSARHSSNSMPQFLYRLQPTRPAMLTEGLTEKEASLVAERFAYLQRLVAEGTLFMAGRDGQTGSCTALPGRTIGCRPIRWLVPPANFLQALRAADMVQALRALN